MLSDFRKTQFQKSLIFSEGARAVLVNFSDLSQIDKNLDSIGVYLDRVELDLSVYEDRI